MDFRIRSAFVTVLLVVSSFSAQAASHTLVGFGQAATPELALQYANDNIQTSCDSLGGTLGAVTVTDSGYQFGDFWVEVTGRCRV